MAFWCLLSAPSRKMYILHGIRFKRVHYYKHLPHKNLRLRSIRDHLPLDGTITELMR